MSGATPSLSFRPQNSAFAATAAVETLFLADEASRTTCRRGLTDTCRTAEATSPTDDLRLGLVELSVAAAPLSVDAVGFGSTMQRESMGVGA